MKIHEPDPHPNSTILLIPGFDPNLAPGEVRRLFLRGLRKRFPNARYSESKTAVSGMTGIRISIDDARTRVAFDLFTLEWAAKLHLASNGKWWQKLTWGGLLLAMFLNWRILKSLRESPLWAAALVSSTALIVLWLWGVAAVGATAVGKSGITDLINASWGTSLADTGKWMLESKFWIWPTAILTAANIDLDRSIDLADLLRRYLFGVRESDNSTMRETLRFEVSDAVDAVAAGAKTDVTIVAHSFGCVMALDYIAASSPVKRIDLFTLGGFLKFLSAENPQLVQPLISGALASPSLAKWTDFYSPNDWLATTTPIVTPSSKYEPRTAVRQVSWADRLLGKSHLYYFDDPTVVDAVLESATVAERG